MYETTMNTHVQVSCKYKFSFFVGKRLGSVRRGRCPRCCVLRPRDTWSLALAGTRSGQPLPAVLTGGRGGGAVGCFSFGLQFSNDWRCWASLHALVSHPRLLFGEASVHVSRPFLVRLLFPSCKASSDALDTRPDQMRRVFSPSLSVVFLLSRVSFEEKFLMLMSSDLSTALIGCVFGVGPEKIGPNSKPGIFAHVSPGDFVSLHLTLTSAVHLERVFAYGAQFQ